LSKYVGQDQPGKNMPKRHFQLKASKKYFFSDVLRESCIIALDFVEYNLGNEFQYADALTSTSEN